MKYPIPKTSSSAWERLKTSNLPLNASLIFDRFVPDLSKVPEKLRGDAKKESLNDVILAAQKRADSALFDAFKTRWEKSITCDQAISFTMSTDWRLIAGLGRKGPLEVGFTFHRYGFPILPGSSVKGLARAWAFNQIAEGLELEGNALGKLDKVLCEADIKKFDDGLRKFEKHAAAFDLAIKFRKIFGTTDEAGQAVFFDATPDRLPKLDLDIMNPHYPDYYQSKEPPTDWQNPNPILFLAVAANQPFRFAVGWRGLVDADAQKQAKEWLEMGLIHLGAGGKTSAGYGYFKGGEAGVPVLAQAVIPAISPQISRPPDAPVLTRRGTIVEIRPDKHAGKLRDIESNQEYTFSTSVIQGDTPGKGNRVTFDLQGNTVVRVKR